MKNESKPSSLGTNDKTTSGKQFTDKNRESRHMQFAEGNGRKHLSKVAKYALILATLWTLAIVGVGTWGARQEIQHAREFIRNEARTHFLKDQAFRFWGAMHGGVYVPPTEHPPPSPYLSHIPDRDIETVMGKKLTLMNPAYMVRQLMEDYEELYGVKGRITSLKPLRPENAPDDWERTMLESFERGETEASEFAEIDGEPYLRLMSPMIARKPCLKCHAKQGYEEGDIRGGVGVSVPTTQYMAIAQEHIIPDVVGHGVLWLLGLALLYFSARRIQQRERERKQAEEALRISEEKYRELADSLSQIVFETSADGLLTYVNKNALEQSGYSQEDFEKGVFALDMLIAEDRERAGKNFRLVLQNEKNGRYEYTALRKDGSTFPITVHSRSIIQDGVPIGLRGIIINITERKQAEQALRVSEEKYRALIETTDTGYLILDEVGRVIDANPEYVRMTGHRTLNDILDRSVVEWTAEHAREKNAQAVNKCMEQGFVRNLEIDYVDGDGVITPIEINAKVVETDDGLRILSLCRDITERKQAEEALRESEEKYRGIFDESVAAIYIFDNEKKFIDSNQAGLDLLGYSQEELLKMSIPEVDADPEVVLPAHHQLLTGGSIVNYEHRLVRKDGRIITVLNNSRPLTDSEGAVTGMQSTLIDITERKQAEEALRESEERFRTVLEAAPDLMIVLDANGRYLDIHTPDAGLLIAPSEQLLGKTIHEVMPAKHAQMIQDVINQAISTGELQQLEYALDIDGANTWFSGRVATFTMKNTDCVLWSTRDITESKQAEEAIRSSEVRLKALSEASFESIFISEKGVCLDQNQTAETMFGYTHAEALGRHGTDWIVPEDRERVKNNMLSGRVEPYDVTALRKDGTTFPAEIQARMIDHMGRSVRVTALRDITERKQAAEALRESEERFRTIFETAEDSIFIKDRNLKYTMANPAMERLFGMSVLQIIGKTDSELFGEEAGRHIQEIDTRVLDGEILHEEHTKPINGVPTTFNVVKVPMRDTDGNIIGLCGIARDITERERAAEALAKSETFLNTTGEIAKIGGWELDVKTLERRWTEETFHIFQLPVGQVPTLEEALNYYHPEDRPKLEKAIQRAIEHGEPYDLELRLITAKGNLIWTRAICTHQVADAKTVKLTGTLHDITERKQAEEALIESENRYQELFSSVMEGIGIVDENETIKYLNPAFAKIFGEESVDDMLGKNILDYFSESQKSILRSETEKRKAGFSSRYEVEMTAADGKKKQLYVSVTPRLDENNEYVGGIGAVLDVTETKHLQAQKSRAERLETAGRIAGQVAHDFNNLLTPLMAYPALLREELPKDSSMLSCLSDIEESARQMAEINQQLLTLGRRGHYNQVPMNLNEIVLQSVREMKLLPDTLICEVDLAEDLMNIMGGGAQMHRVLLNLLHNARDAMKDIGKITVKTENYYVDDVSVLYSRVPKGEYVKLTISDTGCGIPDDIVQQIFDPFFTSKTTDRKRGSGLGLSVVDAVVKDHEGFTDLSSKIGEGTSFYLYFPITREDISGCESGQLAGGTERVLVVDDDEVQRDVSSRLLEKMGYKVTVAESGKKAIEFLKENAQDLLILDMVMPPGMDGTATFERALEINPEQKAIIVSGYSATERILEMQKLGAGAFVKKPITLHSITAAVRKELDRKAKVAAH